MTKKTSNGNGNGRSQLSNAQWGGIIALLLAIVGFFGKAALEDFKGRIQAIEQENKALGLALQTERARVDSLQTATGTVTGLLDRIGQDVRSIDNRLTKFELVMEDYRLKNKR